MFKRLKAWWTWMRVYWFYHTHGDYTAQCMKTWQNTNGWASREREGSNRPGATVDRR